MEKKRTLPLDEKIRILSRIILDIVEKDNLKRASRIKLTRNQFLILRILYRAELEKIGDLADVLNISKPAVSKNIHFLVQKRLIRREEIEGNRRSLGVSLLQKGRDIVERYLSTSEKKIKSVLEGFSDDERESLNRLLDKYICLTLEQERDFSLFCLQCGGEYEGECPISEHRLGCYFQIKQ